MHSPPLTPKNKQKEWTSIQLIARNNNFSQNLLHKLNQQIQHQKNQPGKNQRKKQKQNLNNLHVKKKKEEKSPTCSNIRTWEYLSRTQIPYSSSQSQKQEQGIRTGQESNL